jgi:hypothetical protein
MRCARAEPAGSWAPILTLVMSALAGGDCIDDADALRAGGTSRILGFSVKAPSTVGTFLRSFRWGHVRQLNRVSRELLARAWAAGAGPGDAPFTIDLDSTVCETYGLKKEGALHHGYTHVRGYHPLLAVAAASGEVLMARLREGRAATVRGAAHFLRETIGRVRAAGATGELTLRADSGFYAHAVVATCRQMNVRFSITARLHGRRLRGLIEAIPESDWTPIPYWIGGGADVAEISYVPFADEQDAAPVRLIVRRVRPTPGSQLALFTAYDYHPFITDREGPMLELEADHRRHAEIENAIRDLKYGMGLNHLPSGRFAANGAWLANQVMAHNQSPLDGEARSRGRDRDHQDAPPPAVRPGRAAHPVGPPPHAPPAGPLAPGRRVHGPPSRGSGPSAARLTVSRTHRPLRGWRERGRKSVPGRRRHRGGPRRPSSDRRPTGRSHVCGRRRLAITSSGLRQVVSWSASVDSGLDRAFARWCFTVERDRPRRWAAAFSDAARTAATTPTSRSVARSAGREGRTPVRCVGRRCVRLAPCAISASFSLVRSGATGAAGPPSGSWSP